MMAKRALVLAGAGGRGIIQAGMIKAYLDLGIEYDALYGSSAGSLNGALLHAGQMGDMLDLWRNLRNKDVYSYAPWNMFIRNKGCLYDSAPLLKLIKKVVNFGAILTNPKDFIVNITNLTLRQPEGLGLAPSTPNPAEILWASASPPILTAPVRDWTGEWITDGGITNNYSIIDAVNFGAEKIIVLAPMVPEPRPIRNIIDSIDITISIQIYNQLQRELKFIKKLNEDPRYRHIDVRVVSVDRPTGIGILDFEVADKEDWIEYGYKLAMTELRGAA